MPHLPSQKPKPSTFIEVLQQGVSLLFFRYTVPTLLILFAIGFLSIISFTKYQQKHLIQTIVERQEKYYADNAQQHSHQTNTAPINSNRLTAQLVIENQHYLNETLRVLAGSLVGFFLITILIIRKLKGNSTLLNSFILQLQGMNDELQKEITTRDQMAYQLATLNDDLKFQALHDTLTQLPNRRLFEDRLQSTIRSSKRMNRTFAVMLADLDGFKLINDTLGHDIGDLLLQEVAARFNQTIRDMDTVARLGGDEFAFILSHLTRPEEAALVAERLIKAVSQTIFVKHHQLNISVSIGITAYPFDSNDGLTLLKNADVAMYNSKNQAYSSFQFFREDMNNASKRELLLRHDFIEALNQSKLQLYYQPIIDMDAHSIAHFEALLRWQHPQLGSIPPFEILRLADHLGLHLQLGQWIIQEACRQLAQWQTEDFHVPHICINVTSQQFEQSNFIEQLKQTATQQGVQLQQLVLEVTEANLVKNIPLIAQVFADLQALGVRIAIDDFGTGYSSLNYLRQLPVQIIKIDQSFVSALSDNENDSNNGIVHAILALAHFLNLEAIAEGVETATQCRLLKKMGCHKMQGFLFSKALTADDCLHLVIPAQEL